MKTSSPSSLPKLLAASAVAALVTLSTATVAHAARHEDPWDPNSWAPEVIGGAVGGAVGGVVALILYRTMSRDIREFTKEIKESIKEIKESANNAGKLTQALDENRDNLKKFKESLTEDILDKIKRN